MSEIRYYILDLETTGLNHKVQECTEISIIRASDKLQLTRMIKCDFPERASLDALRITGKSLEDLKRGETKIDVVNKCNDFFAEDGCHPKDRCIVGHNIINFDKKFLHALWESQGKEFPANLWLDTMQLTKQLYKNKGIKEKANLEASCNFLGIRKNAAAHSARGDSRSTYLLWKKLLESGVDYLPYLKCYPHNVIEEDVNDLINFDED